jgi:hypothetical protein
MGPWAEVGKKLDANISNNKIYVNENFGGIWGCSVQDAVITNNKIWGNGVAGILCGGWGDPCTDWVIKGNNVQGVNAQVAPIWLCPSTSNFLVVGGSNKTNVLNEGTENILTGVNNMHGNPPGPEIRDAMMRKLEMMKSFSSLRGR